jgi:hypothetical protein
MDIVFNLHQAFYPGSSEVDNALALRALLEGMINLNLAYLRHHSTPPLYESGVVYGRTTIWEPTAALYLPNKHPRRVGRITYWDPLGNSGGKQRGDCKSLSAALIAEKLMKHQKAWPNFRFKKREDGSGLVDFHILVETPSGHEDPSAKLGMNSDELRYFGL